MLATPKKASPKSPLVVDRFADLFGGDKFFAASPGPGSYDTGQANIARSSNKSFNHRSGSFGTTASRDTWVHEPHWLSGPLKPPRLTTPVARTTLAFADAPWPIQDRQYPSAGQEMRTPPRAGGETTYAVWDSAQNRMRTCSGGRRHASRSASPMSPSRGATQLYADRVSPARARQVAKAFAEREREAIKEWRARTPPRSSSAPPARPTPEPRDAYGMLAARSAAEDGARYARALNAALVRAADPPAASPNTALRKAQVRPEDPYEEALRQSRQAAKQRVAQRPGSNASPERGSSPSERKPWVDPSPFERPMEAYEIESDSAWLASRKAISDAWLRAREEERRLAGPDAADRLPFPPPSGSLEAAVSLA